MKIIIKVSFTGLLLGFYLAGAFGQNQSEFDSLYGASGKSNIEIAEDLVWKLPTGENFLYLSIAYYNEGRYENCIEACEKALELQPDYAAAYNNICAAYNELEEWDKAFQACNLALTIDPEFQLAENNRQRSLLYINAHKTIEQTATSDDYINLGLVYYNDKKYKQSIKYFEKAIEIEPKNAIAYNNICSAYNRLQKWDEAIKACEKAISLDVNFQLAKNNLNYSKSMKGEE